MTNPVAVFNILDQATKLISVPERWHQGFYNDTYDFDTATKYCPIGAILKVAEHADRSDRYEAECILGAVIGAAYPDFKMKAMHPQYTFAAEKGESAHVPEWNDEDGRKHAEVKAMMKAARQVARARAA